MRIDRPERLTRLDWQRFSRFFVVGDLRRPQTLAPGLTPAQTRARGQDLMDSTSARADLFRFARLSDWRKGKWLAGPAKFCLPIVVFWSNGGHQRTPKRTPKELKTVWLS
jgi:hypothetical protein